jgi:hypothetical protein
MSKNENHENHEKSDIGGCQGGKESVTEAYEGIRRGTDDETNAESRQKRTSTKKHPCPDCTFCQHCSEDRCRLCVGRKSSCCRKLSMAEQIARYDALNAAADEEGHILQDKRSCNRMEASLELKVSWPEDGQVRRAVTRDLSDGGTFVFVTLEPPPPVGTEILLQLDRLVLGEEPPVLKARVVRITENGVAFEFLIPDKA